MKTAFLLLQAQGIGMGKATYITRGFINAVIHFGSTFQNTQATWNVLFISPNNNLGRQHTIRESALPHAAFICYKELWVINQCEKTAAVMSEYRQCQPNRLCWLVPKLGFQTRVCSWFMNQNLN